MKLTKKQRKDRDRILAWLNDEEFKENSRAKPAVPNLSTDEVLESYVPPDITGAAQYFTPPEMAEYLISRMNVPLYGDDVRILDPCAGIGHLLRPFLRFDDHLDLVAYELEQECVEIGRRLFPRIEWNWKIPFDHLEKIEGRFNYVVLNPPFGTTRGIYPGQDMCRGHCTRSEHVFFELAVRACLPDGCIGVIAPYNFIKRWPKAFRRWCDLNVALEAELGKLPGEFAWSGIMVYGYIFRRLDPLAKVYERTAERQHAPNGVMTKVKEEWAELNEPSGLLKAEQLILF